MASADVVRGPQERTSSPSRRCADLGISRRTFYEWRAKGTAPRCISLPNGTCASAARSITDGWPRVRRPLNG